MRETDSSSSADASSTATGDERRTSRTDAEVRADGGSPDETAAETETEAEKGDGNENEIEDEDGLCVGVVTIATDRRLESDTAGEAIVSGLEAAGHEIATREHIGSDHDRIQSIAARMIDRDDVDLVITGGGTSVEPSDVTLEAIEPLLDKRLRTFDELFTSLTYEAVGSRAVAARTIAGITEGIPVFCLPGNADAAALGLEKIILPEAEYLVDLAREDVEADRWAADADGDGNGDDDDGESTPEPDADAENGGT